ncbi:receptor-type tyrosine-protein phosphatase delta, partial [Trichonephila clavata]
MSQVRGDCETPWNVTIQNSLIITWSGEDRETDVLVQVTPDATSANRECKSQNLTVPFSAKEVRIDPLCSNTTHVIKASLACGDKITQTNEFELLSDDLLAPSNFSFVSITNISITLEWDTPEFSEKPIIAYQVRRSKTDAFEAADIYHTSTTKYTFAGLIPYTLYYFEVRASTETTVGPWSETLPQQTKVGVPFAPVGVSEEYVTNSSISVRWKEPQPFCGPIILYTIQYSKKSDPNSFNDTIVESANYTIENLLPYTEYSIQVRAKTEAGFGPWSAALIALTDVGIPSVPTDLVAINTTARSILLTWNAPDPANGPSLEYLMSWGVRGSSISQVLVLGTEFLADTLVPHTEYSFQVAAKTSAGLGPKSKRLYVWTKIDVPSEPLNLTAVEVTNTSITIEWASPEYHNGPILAYIVQYYEFSNETTNDTNDSITKETKENTTTLESLKPNTLYVIRVCARTEAGTGPYSDDLEVQTNVGVPGPPKEVSTEVNVTSIILTWQQPDHVPGMLLDYLLSWGVQGTPESTVTIKNEFLHYDAVGLRPYTAYSFRLAARTEAGAGPAVSVSIRTEITTPSITRELRAVDGTDTSIFLEWLAPEHPNGPLVSYTVKWYDASNSSDTVGLQETNSTSFRIENLEPSTNYSVQVVAKTSAGEGPWSNVIIASTREKGSQNNDTLILAIVLGTAIPLVLILLIIGIIFARRKGACKLRKEPPKQSQERQIPTISSPSIQLEAIQRNPRNLTVRNFEESMKAMTRYGTQGFMQEFE